MKLILRLLFACCFMALGFGLHYKHYVDFATGEKIIGFAVSAAAFIFLPLFLYHRWKGKKLKDYTLSEENLKKMRENIENQPISKSKKSEAE